MKIRLLSLNADASMTFAKFQSRVVSSIKMYTEDSVAFEHYLNMKDLFDALEESLQLDDIIITAVDTIHYNKFKKIFTTALGTETQYNSTVLNLIENREDLDDNQKKDLSAFPEPATVFLSKDGMYSGFGIENGSQFVALIPIDNDRINLILRNGLVPFLSNNIKDENGNPYLEENKLFDDEKVRLTVQRLIDTDSVVAVNGTPNAEVIKSCGDTVLNFDDVFIFTPYVEDKGDVNATEYAAQLAKVSLDLSAANIGASISEIYTAGESKYICVAVANDESAVVRKLYMSEGESDDEFVLSAAMELIEIIGEKALGIQSVGIEVAEEIPQNIMPEEVKKKANKKGIIIWSAVIGVILVLCAIVGIMYKVQGDNGPVANAFNKIFGSAETTTTLVPDTTKETISQEVVPNKTDKLLISQIMEKEIVDLEKLRAETPETSTTEVQSDTETTTENSIKGVPEFITVNGEKIDAKDALARLVMTEMGEGYSEEAIKAQTVVIYTYLKYRDNDFTIDDVKISDVANDEVKKAVDSVFGEYLTYNNEVALTPFFGASAIKTASSKDVFSKEYPYLKTVDIKNEKEQELENYKTENIYTVGEMKGMLLSYNGGLNLANEPEKWIAISSHDASISSVIGYVSSILVGGEEMTGYQFRKNVLGFDKLNSHCFTIEFDKVNDNFKVTSFGDGICVGMSKGGANLLAEKGLKYNKILSTYYNGTKISKEVMV